MEHRLFEKAASELEIPVEKYLQLVELFVEDSRTQLEALSKAIDTSDRQTADTVAHHIAGAAENLEFNDFAHAARSLREILSSPDREAVQLRERLEQVLQEFRTVENRIKGQESN